MSAPLLVTLALDDATLARLDGLRRRYFPADRNVVPAHLMLFHQLPDEPVVLDDVAAVSTTSTFEVAFDRPRSLGGGVALRAEAFALQAIRADLAARWAAWLTPQDRQRYEPHVTVQNKVTPARARVTLAELRDGLVPWRGTAVGLDVWTYRGGPWEHRVREPFADRPLG